MDIHYNIKRSAKRKKLTITVERDKSIVVHAPTHTTEEKIEQIVNSKRQWLYDKLHHSQKYQTPEHPPGKELVNGESAMYLGRNYKIVVADTPSGEIEFDRQFLVPSFLVNKKKDILFSWYQQRANEKVLPIVNDFARKLGVDFSSAKIVNNKFRWGSCSVNNNLTFNWRLIKAPMIVIEYIVVHELAHLIEPNHTPRFWNIVNAQIPNVDKAKNWLKDHGQMLEEVI